MKRVKINRREYHAFVAWSRCFVVQDIRRTNLALRKWEHYVLDHSDRLFARINKLYGGEQ